MEHDALQRKLLSFLPLKGEPFEALHPGDELQPSYLDVPSRPRADFLWASLGSFVVSKRIRDIFVSSWPEDIVACPVELRKIGTREATLPPPIPSTGEPEDMINEVPLSRNSTDIGPYFEILVQKESGFPVGGTPVTICSGCKRPEMDESTRELRITSGMWNGSNLFFLATTLHVLVTDEVRDRLLQIGATNIDFE